MVGLKLLVHFYETVSCANKLQNQPPWVGYAIAILGLRELFYISRTEKSIDRLDRAVQLSAEPVCQS